MSDLPITGRAMADLCRQLGELRAQLRESEQARDTAHAAGLNLTARVQELEAFSTDCDRRARAAESDRAALRDALREARIFVWMTFTGAVYRHDEMGLLSREAVLTRIDAALATPVSTEAAS